MLARWRSTIFSDDTRIAQIAVNRYMETPLGTRFQNDCIREAGRWGVASIMAWAAISFNSRTPLVVIDGNLNARRYVDEILMHMVIVHGPERPSANPLLPTR